MHIDHLIRELEYSLLGKAFTRGILTSYDIDTWNGLFAENEESYDRACSRLRGLLTTCDMEDELRKIRLEFRKNRMYAARYGFKCGMFCAYEQAFTDSCESDGGFTSTVVEGLMASPGMDDHPLFTSRLEKIRKLEDRVTEMLGPEESESVSDLDCALSDRVYHASLTGFYLGYRMGIHELTQVDPILGEQVLGKVQTMKKTLQFADSFREFLSFAG